MSKDHCGRERPRKARSYTARDVGRIAANAREDGANDADMVAYLLEAFGVGRFGCALYELMQFTQNVAMFGAVIGLLRGAITLLAGMRKLSKVSPVRFTAGVIDLLIPKKYKTSYGAVLAYVGATEVVLNGVMSMLILLSNSHPLYKLSESVCKGERKALGLKRIPEPLGPIDTIVLLVEAMQLMLQGALDRGTLVPLRKRDEVNGNEPN